MTTSVKVNGTFVRRPAKWRTGVDVTGVLDSRLVDFGRVRKVARKFPDGAIDILTKSQEFHHNVRVEGSTEFHDYETFGSDEHGSFPFLNQTILSTQGPSTTLLSWRRGFGGEERVEIDITGALNSSTGVLTAQLAVRFYEGATEGTTELEDSEAWSTSVPINGTSNFDIFLANDEDDWARVIGSVANQRL